MKKLRLYTNLAACFIQQRAPAMVVAVAAEHTPLLACHHAHCLLLLLLQLLHDCCAGPSRSRTSASADSRMTSQQNTSSMMAWAQAHLPSRSTARQLASQSLTQLSTGVADGCVMLSNVAVECASGAASWTVSLQMLGIAMHIRSWLFTGKCA
jgi:hypothetical protein